MQAEERAVDRGPVKVFVALLAVVGVVVAVAIWTSQPQPAAAPETPAAPPDYSLTNAEALARFKELHSELRQASKQRSASVAESILTTDSPLQEVAARDTRQLINDGVLDKSVFDTVSIKIVANADNEIELLQRVIVRPRFVDEATGKNVSGSQPVIQTVEWTLRQQAAFWLLHDGVVTDREKLR